MDDCTHLSRRHFLGAAAAMAVVARRIEAKSASSFGSIRQVKSGVLNVGYAEVGPVNGQAVILLHGWPYDIYSFEESAALLAAQGFRVIVPYLRGYGSTQFLSGDTPRNGQQSAMAQDVTELMDALQLRSAVLGGFDWGSRTAAAVAAVWPERCKGLVAVSGYLITNLALNKQPLPPAAEQGWWYQYYFSTERGRIGYEKNRHEFAKLIWRNASPKWKFDDATYDRSARAFENPDHVAIVIHNYRWRLGLADGESRYAAVESRLQTAPAITVPTITIGSDFDGAAADGKSYAAKFTGRYSHRVLDGIGHNVPQEAPKEFAQAIVQVSRA
jgi:pimeloyl-ACP methyl ester carboxylesterase